MLKDITLLIVAFLSAMAFLLPKRYFLLPYILAACFVPTDQRIIIMTLEFTALRILIVAGVVRILMRGEYTKITWNKFDKMVIVWIVCGAVVYMLQWMDIKAVKNRSGTLFDVIGLYWIFRQNLRSWSDVEAAFKVMALSVLFLAPLVAAEWTTGRNPFAALGTVTTAIREGRYRCQASFPHSIMLGLFWATAIPMFIGFAAIAKKKKFYWAASAAAVFIIFGTASSTPVATMLEIFLLLALFRWRGYGRQIVYSLCGLAVVLHIIMAKPVWHLIARMNIVGGSTGWYRYFLIDETIKHFNEWWLLGVRNTGKWGMGLEDVTNQYVLEGVRGGLITLILFIILLVMAVRTVCRFSLRPMPPKQQWFFWCICVAILGHCLSFVGVSYFGQITMLLYLMFAIVGFIYELSLRPAPIQSSAAAARPVRKEHESLSYHS